jgi:disulfide bond formation protein DsbB
MPLIIVLMLSAVLVACGGGGAAPAEEEVVSRGNAENGKTLYNTTCIACHGDGGIGVEGLGKPLTTSEFVSGMNDDEFHAFLLVGRPSSDPANTTGVDMPPKGGNPALTDDNLYDIIAYIRTLQAAN